jgi:hypothetical protein
MENTSPPKPTKKNREMLLLTIVAIVGLAGLAVLQFARKGPSNNTEKNIVQADNQSVHTTAQTAAPIQQVPGELLRTSEHPEAGKPFRFKMAKFAQGATYELQFADGSRKQFKNGEVNHTFPKSGPVVVTLYARFEGQEVRLDTLHRIVARRAEKIEVAPIIDY